ncbi:MAG TPA: fatty acyl-AMP ligase [Stellaceae bacterium]|nr:fatty acyl-AMP ligase [Stellaceae bacterium]
MLCRRAIEQGGERAYIFLPDRGGERSVLTFAGLHARARALARHLAERGEQGDRAALLFPPGLDFVAAFFGCLLAGIVAAPLMIPRRDSRRDASRAILADCAPRFLLTTRALVETSRPDLHDRLADSGGAWVFCEDVPADPGSEAGGEAEPLAALRRDDIAFLQYTSGSTSTPKGVMVSHGNLLDNSEMIRIAFGNTQRSTYVSWVPLYHDMGLILNVLQSLYVGALCVLMAPVTFMQRPLNWLRAIHEFRAEVAGGPNFAFDHCVARYRAEEMEGVDLSSWKLAFNGAEPVRAETIERFVAVFARHGFAATALYPAYGMAEATLLISGGRRGDGPVLHCVSRDALQHRRIEPRRREEGAQVLVGCGRPLSGEALAIVDPDSRRRLAPGEIGEIWAAGPNVAQGYWHNPEATRATFGGRIAGEDSGAWLRTGDLGFFDAASELFITGRIKDLIIIRGINHYPQDIEHTVETCHPALRRHGGAAFAAEESGEERLVVVQEVERGWRRRCDPAEITATIRAAVVREHDIAPYRVVLIRPGTLPQTTSGKIQRGRARQLWRAGALEIVE